MTEAPAFHSPLALKIKALELANGNNEPHDAVIKRATAYHAYLSNTVAAAAAPTAGATTAAPKTGATTAAPKAGTTAAPKTGTATPPAQKPAAAKPAAAKPGTNPAPSGGTSAEGLVMDDVSKALQLVLNAGVNQKADKDTQAKQKAVGKTAAYKILADVGGADSVRNVKPDKYAAVIAACQAAVKKPAAKPAAAPAAEPDDFGATADDGADGQTADASTDVEGDPPEQTGAGEDA